MSSLAHIDIETTGLDADRHEIWEVGLVLEDTEATVPVSEHHWFVPVHHLGTADPTALGIGGFYERHPAGDNESDTGKGATYPLSFARQFEALTRGATLVGANVRFDERFLDKYLKEHGAVPGWYFRLCDVEALGQGKLRLPLPMGLAKTAAQLEVPNTYEAHTALDDAKLSRDVYWTIVEGKPRV